LLFDKIVIELEKSSQEGGEAIDFKSTRKINQARNRSPIEYYAEPVSPSIALKNKKIKGM